MAKKKASRSSAKPRLPGSYKAFVTKYPALGRAHESIASTVMSVGPLSPRSAALIKIGICIGAGLESALRSHVRRAMEQGASPSEIEQAILLGMNTVGFPRTVAAWSWAQEQFKRGND